MFLNLACPWEHLTATWSSNSPGITDPWDGRSGGRGTCEVGTCCPCWGPSCSCELSYRRQTRATSAWPPGSRWGCATLATSSLSRMSSRCVAVGTGDTGLGCGMSGHDHAPAGKSSDGHLMLETLDTVKAQAACVAALCLPCASQWGTRCPRDGAGGSALGLPYGISLTAHLLSLRMSVAVSLSWK